MDWWEEIELYGSQTYILVVCDCFAGEERCDGCEFLCGKHCCSVSVDVVDDLDLKCSQWELLQHGLSL